MADSLRSSHIARADYLRSSQHFPVQMNTRMQKNRRPWIDYLSALLAVASTACRIACCHIALTLCLMPHIPNIILPQLSHGLLSHRLLSHRKLSHRKLSHRVQSHRLPSSSSCSLRDGQLRRNLDRSGCRKTSSFSYGLIMRGGSIPHTPSAEFINSLLFLRLTKNLKVAELYKIDVFDFLDTELRHWADLCRLAERLCILEYGR